MVNFSHPLWALEIVVENVEKSHTASQDDIKVSSPKVIVRVRGDQTIGQVMASVSEQCGKSLLCNTLRIISLPLVFSSSAPPNE